MFNNPKLKLVARNLFPFGMTYLVADSLYNRRRNNRIARKLIEIDDENQALREELERTCKQYNYLCDILIENEIDVTDFDMIVLTTNLM